MSNETQGLTVRAKLKLRRGPKGRKRVTSVPVEAAPTPDVEQVPRIARLMALAIVMDEMVRTGQVESYAEIARMAGVSRARVSQVIGLLRLAPTIQAQLLRPELSDASELSVRSATARHSWKEQQSDLGSQRRNSTF